MENRIRYFIIFFILIGVSADSFAESCPSLLNRIQSSVSEFRSSRKGKMILAGSLLNLMMAPSLFNFNSEFISLPRKSEPHYLLRTAEDPLTGQRVIEIFDGNDPLKRTLSRAGVSGPLTDSPMSDRE